VTLGCTSVLNRRDYLGKIVVVAFSRDEEALYEHKAIYAGFILLANVNGQKQ
jgi:hypothetical protein